MEMDNTHEPHTRGLSVALRGGGTVAPTLPTEKLRLRGSGLARFPQLVQVGLGFRLQPADSREGLLLLATRWERQSIQREARFWKGCSLHSPLPYQGFAGMGGDRGHDRGRGE